MTPFDLLCCMKLPWNDPRTNKFKQQLDLITSDGQLGPISLFVNGHIIFLMTLD